MYRLAVLPVVPQESECRIITTRLGFSPLLFLRNLKHVRTNYFVLRTIIITSIILLPSPLLYPT